MPERIGTNTLLWMYKTPLSVILSSSFVDRHTISNFLCSKMPPKQSEPFPLIPSETLLLGHCCQPQIKLRFVPKNPRHTLDKLCLSHWACLDVAQATAPVGWPFCSIPDTSQAEFQHPSPSLSSSSLLLSLYSNKEISEGTACLIPHHKPLTSPTELGLCTAAIALQHCNIAVQSFILHSQAGYLHLFGAWERQHLWASPAFPQFLPAFLSASKQIKRPDNICSPAPRVN